MAGFLETIFKGKSTTAKGSTKSKSGAKVITRPLSADAVESKPEAASKNIYDDTASVKDIIDHLEKMVDENKNSNLTSDKVPVSKETANEETANEVTVNEETVNEETAASSETESAETVPAMEDQMPEEPAADENGAAADENEAAVPEEITFEENLILKDEPIPEEPIPEEPMPEEPTADENEAVMPEEITFEENLVLKEEPIPEVSPVPEEELIPEEEPVPETENTAKEETVTDNSVIREVDGDQAVNAAEEEDDYLLAQIEELRSKAMNLKQIMTEKEMKAKELEDLVEVRSTKADELQKILDERQEKADGITAAVEKQIDVLIEKVENRMITIERSMYNDLDRVDHSVNENLQNMQKDTTARLEEIRALTQDTEPYRKINEEQTAVLQNSMETENKELLMELEQLKKQLNGLKAEVAEKIHNENVKCYRNVSDLIKENDTERKDAETAINGRLTSIRSVTVGVAVCTIVNICGITALILFFTGVLHI